MDCLLCEARKVYLYTLALINCVLHDAIANLHFYGSAATIDTTFVLWLAKICPYALMTTLTWRQLMRSLDTYQLLRQCKSLVVQKRGPKGNTVLLSCWTWDGEN